MDISRWNRTTSLLALQLSVDHLLGLAVYEEEIGTEVAPRPSRPLANFKGVKKSPSRMPLRHTHPSGLPRSPVSSHADARTTRVGVGDVARTTRGR